MLERVLLDRSRRARETPRVRCLIVPAVLAALLVGMPDARAKDSPYQQDVKVALERLETDCARLIRSKKLAWKKIASEFKKAAKSVNDDQGEFELLVRLIARMRDGHARVMPSKDVTIKPLVEGRQRGPCMFWCRDGDGNVLVKRVWGDAEGAGVTPGMRVVEVEGEKVDKWLAGRIAEMRETASISTDHRAEYDAFHWGLAGPEGSLLAVELRDTKGKKKKVRAARTGSMVNIGPAVFPEGLQTTGRQSYGKTTGGYGYIHLRDCRGELLTQLDTALAAIGNVPGMILDFRANGGGGTDHPAVFGRFLPEGEKWSPGHGIQYVSAGATPYGGPIVVIVDAGVFSAGETVSGMFKEDGRAYMIGPGPTAGSSSSKITIELPSKKFSLYVSVASNKGRFNQDNGIEGIGVPPHEIVPYDAESLAAGVDPLIKRAEEILAKFPKKAVRYNPKKAGWKRN